MSILKKCLIYPCHQTKRFVKYLLSFTALPCLGKLGNCPVDIPKRWHFTCFHCRWRRKTFNGWTDPPYWIRYLFPWTTRFNSFLHNGQRYWLPEGVRFQKLIWLMIDPRGHFTMLRCSIIIVLDKIQKRNRYLRDLGLMRVCEFFASYPSF